jgi:hypothetical protein
LQEPDDFAMRSTGASDSTYYIHYESDEEDGSEDAADVHVNLPVMPEPIGNVDHHR